MCAWVEIMKILPLLLLLTACSHEPLTEDEKYDREIGEIEAKEKFLREEAACERRGGVMIYEYHSVSKRNEVPEPKDIIKAECETAIDRRRRLDF